jgi:hypothetical protein
LAESITEVAGDEPGILDKIVEAEEKFQEFNETVLEIASKIEEVTYISEKHTPKLNRLAAENAPISKRLIYVRKVANDLEKPAEEIKNLGKKYVSNLVDVDSGYGAIFELLEFSENYQIDLEKELKQEEFESFAISINLLREKSTQAVDQLKGFLKTLKPIGDLSRDMRKPIKKIETGIRNITNAQEIIEGWREKSREVKKGLGEK